MLHVLRNLLSDTLYMPFLPWKQGERDAFQSVATPLSTRILPVFEVPPAGDFDHELGHIATPAEHIRHFGSRLLKCRGRLPAFVDACQIDDARHRIGGKLHPLTALLERARLSGAQAWPVAKLDLSDDYRSAVRKTHRLHGSPIALRVSLSNLDKPNLRATLSEACQSFGCTPSEVALLVDGRSLHINDVADFTSLLVGRLNELPFLHEWGQLALAATSLTDPLKIPTATTKTIDRKEWLVYEQLVQNTDLLRLPLFSDYGVEFKEQLRPIKARPTAKINYTTGKSYFYTKGQNVKNGGYDAIYPVAKEVTDSTDFMGASFSEGDAHIALLSEKKVGPGGAPKWRWAAVDHHLTVTARGLGRILALDLEVRAVKEPEPQDDLFNKK